MTSTPDTANFMALAKEARVAQLRDNIPEELRARRQWLCWNAAKAPSSPRTGNLASVTSPRDWGTFEQAITGMLSYEHLEGVGFVFSSDDPYVGADLDHCIGDGVVASSAEAIVAKLDSYTERSQSGQGVHIIVRGELPVAGRVHGDVALYQSERFFALTGDVFPDRPASIEDRTEPLMALYEDSTPATLFGRERRLAIPSPPPA